MVIILHKLRLHIPFLHCLQSIRYSCCSVQFFYASVLKIERWQYLAHSPYTKHLFPILSCFIPSFLLIISQIQKKNVKRRKRWQNYLKPYTLHRLQHKLQPNSRKHLSKVKHKPFVSQKGRHTIFNFIANEIFYVCARLYALTFAHMVCKIQSNSLGKM